LLNYLGIEPWIFLRRCACHRDFVYVVELALDEPQSSFRGFFLRIPGAVVEIRAEISSSTTMSEQQIPECLHIDARLFLVLRVLTNDSAMLVVALTLSCLWLEFLFAAAHRESSWFRCFVFDSGLGGKQANSPRRTALRD
jgi:hypothetical protein